MLRLFEKDPMVRAYDGVTERLSEVWGVTPCPQGSSLGTCVCVRVCVLVLCGVVCLCGVCACVCECVVCGIVYYVCVPPRCVGVFSCKADFLASLSSPSYCTLAQGSGSEAGCPGAPGPVQQKDRVARGAIHSSRGTTRWANTLLGPPPWSRDCGDVIC